MNTCEQIQTELSAYLDGEIAAGERGALEAHIQSCAACRAAMQELESVRTALSDLPKLKAPPSLASRIHSAVNAPVPLPVNSNGGEGSRTISYERPRQKSVWRPAVMAVAALLMAGVIVFLFLPSLSGPQEKTAYAPARSTQPNIGSASGVNKDSKYLSSDRSEPAAGKPAMQPAAPLSQAPLPAPAAAADEEVTVLTVRPLPAKEEEGKPATPADSSALSAKRVAESQKYKDAKSTAALQSADKQDLRGRSAQDAKDLEDRRAYRGENGLKAGEYDDAAQAPAAAAAPKPQSAPAANSAPPAPPPAPGAMRQDKAKDAQQSAQSGQPFAEKKKSDAPADRDETALDGKLKMRADDGLADAEKDAGDKTAGAANAADERMDNLSAEKQAKSMRKMASADEVNKPTVGSAAKSAQSAQSQQAEQAEQLKLARETAANEAGAPDAAGKKQMNQKGSGAGAGGGVAGGDLGLGGPQNSVAQPAKPGHNSTPPPSAPARAPIAAPAVAQAQGQANGNKAELLARPEPKADKADMPVASAPAQPDAVATNGPPAPAADRAKDAVRPAEAQGEASVAKETEKKEASKTAAVKLPQDGSPAAPAAPGNGNLDRRPLAPQKPGDLGTKFGGARALTSNVRTLSCPRAMLPALLAELRKAAGPDAALTIAPDLAPSAPLTGGTGGAGRFEHNPDNKAEATPPQVQVFTLKLGAQQQDAVLARIDALGRTYRARSQEAKQQDADKVGKLGPVASAAKPDASEAGQAQARADEKPRTASKNIAAEVNSIDDDDRKAETVITIRIQLLPDAATETPEAAPSDR